MGRVFKEAISGIIGSILTFVFMVIYAKFNYVNAKADVSYVDDKITTEINIVNEKIVSNENLNKAEHIRIEGQYEKLLPLILDKLERIENNQDKLMMSYGKD